MDKRYQVFVSSTYSDLQEERRSIIQALMEMDCIPAGMELFPAADEQQLEFIKKVIDDCDYYLLVIGGRYGSVTAEGISYTEKEYEYAESVGLPVLAFIHGNPSQLPVAKSDLDPKLRERLEAFRQKVASGRLVRFWDDSRALPGLVALSLQRTIKTFPRTGWVRASSLSGVEALSELNELRKRNEALSTEIAELRDRSASATLPNLAPLDSNIKVQGRFNGAHGYERWEVTVSWRALFTLLAPYLLDHPSDASAKARLEASLFPLSGKTVWGVLPPTMEDQQFQTVKVQLIAYGLVRVDYLASSNGGMALYWSLTANGQSALLELRSVRALDSAPMGSS